MLDERCGGASRLPPVMSHRRSFVASCLIVASTLVACAATPVFRPVPTPESPLRVRVLGADPIVEAACADAVARVLRDRLGTDAVSLDVEVSLWIDTSNPQSTQPDALADLTATHRDHTATQVIASGTGNSTRSVGDVTTAEGRARYAACEDGAAHLAVALAEQRGSR